jgi:TetR/AcrR family transcriptional repressor of nem operon
MQHAAALIRERGFRATSIGDLLERAGVQKGSFYYYFPSKEDLGRAVLDRWVEELRAGPVADLGAVDGPGCLQRVDAVLGSFVAKHSSEGCRGGCPFGNLALELSDVHEGFRTRIAEAFVELTRAFEGALDRARRAGGLRAEAQPSTLAQFLVATVEGGILLAKVHKSLAPLEAAVSAARAHVASFARGAEGQA